MSLQAQVSGYRFASSQGTYQEIEGTVAVHTPSGGGTPINFSGSFLDLSSDPMPLGFTFNINGVEYTEIRVNTNGIIHDPTKIFTYTDMFVPLSTNLASNFFIVPLSGYLEGTETLGSEISYLSTGTAPNRVFVVQFKNVKRYGDNTSNDKFNFQVRLYETSNKIEYIYGSFELTTENNDKRAVGIRGATNTDYVSRHTSYYDNDWANSTASPDNSPAMTLRASCKPASGLTFTFTPNFCLPVTDLTHTVEGNNVTLNWTAPTYTTDTPREYTYTILRNDTEIAFNLTEATSTYTDYGIENGSYNYCVKVVYTDSEDCVSAEVCTSALVNAPSDCNPVIDLTNTVSGKNVTLTWTAPTSKVLLLNEGFGGESFPPAGWAKYNIDGDDTQWGQELTTKTGKYSAGHTYTFTDVYQDGYLVSPLLLLPRIKKPS